MRRKYYEAYDDRYRQVHSQNMIWFTQEPSQIVESVIHRYKISASQQMLEIGCGEGRDASALLKKGFDLLATDVSKEAIAYCTKKWPEFADRFQVMDCISGKCNAIFDLIFAVAVVHMLVPDYDRDAFYKFVYDHLKPGGIGLICTMGDGTVQHQTDIHNAFELQNRVHQQTGTSVQIAATSCRMVTFDTFRDELNRNRLTIIEEGLTSVEPDFSLMMYAVVKRT